MFRGFPAEAFELYDGLAADNSRAYWGDHRAVYDDAVRGPMVALLDELSAEFGRPTVFRPHRDVRFSKDKRPYKEHQGGFIGAEDAIGWYVEVSAAGLMVAGGWYAAQGTQVPRYRDAVSSAAGAELERIVGQVRSARLEVGGDRLRTRPRGVGPDHPRLDLLRHRSLTCSRRYGTPAWVSSRSALQRVRADWRRMAQLVEWLADHVGPADDGPPPEPR